MENRGQVEPAYEDDKDRENFLSVLTDVCVRGESGS